MEKNIFIEKENFILRDISQEYAEDIFKEFTSEVCKYLRVCPAKDISETKLFIAESLQKMEKQKTLQLVITNKQNDFIGLIGIHDLDNNINPELGFWLKESARGKGFGKIAMQEFINYLNNNKEFEYLLYLVDKDNIGSRKVGEKLGGILQVDENGKEIIKQEKTKDPNKILNSVEYRIYKKS